MSKIEQVGFIGLGLMGTSMSNNLLKAGFKVRGYDPLPGAGDGIKPMGARSSRRQAKPPTDPSW